MADEKKQAEEVTEQPLEFRLERRQAADFHVYYANDIQLVSTRFDVQFTFGRVVVPVAPAAGDLVKVEQQLTVIVSHEHTRSLLDLLQKQVAQVDKKPPL